MHTGHIWLLTRTYHIQHVHEHLFEHPVCGANRDGESDKLIIWRTDAQVRVQQGSGRGDLQWGRYFCLCEWARCALLRLRYSRRRSVFEIGSDLAYELDSRRDEKDCRH